MLEKLCFDTTGLYSPLNPNEYLRNSFLILFPPLKFVHEKLYFFTNRLYCTTEIIVHAWEIAALSWERNFLITIFYIHRTSL